uniref:Zinc finger protein 687 n=1 Tax=Terrapene triunguis TaxID=2587831 RepID=A0A674IZ09_9SAUR
MPAWSEGSLPCDIKSFVFLFLGSAGFFTMGDMKTPDFDDLLAAFDIPDIDTNEAIHSGHEEAEVHIKQVPGEPVAPEHVLPHADITAVSVIVKNTVCPEQLDPLDGRGKDGHGLGPRLLQNGFGAPEMPRSPTSRPGEAVASSNGECWASKEKGAKPMDIFSHFSPDPHEENSADLIDRPREGKQKEKDLSVPSLSPSPTPSPAPSPDCKEPAGESTETLPPAFPQSFETSQAGGMNGSPATIPMIKKEESDSEELDHGASPKGLAAALRDSPLGHLKSVTVRYSTDDSPVTSWPSSDPNLDSSTSNLPEVKNSPTSPQEPFFKPSPLAEGSPGPLGSPKPLGSIPLKEEQEALEKPPQSMSSGEEEEEEDEDGSNDSPSSSSSRPLKVRIKTIKTSSGSITRTVTRVSSDSEPGAAKLPSEPGSQEAATEDSVLPAAVVKEESVQEVPKKKMELSSPLKVIEGPKIVSVQLGNGTKIKGTVLPVTTIQNASSAMLIAASVAQQKSVVLPGKAVTKNIINLVPQTLPKADTRTNVSTVTQTTTVTTTANQKVNGTTVVMVQPQKPSPTIAGTVISRSQSSLVEAFNKILNSKNLLPTYKPNLNPPAESSLTLPPFGYRCLECGDSFALEKSLARHYDRRSMRIEVTCNHCTKRLVFFNKCSLLLHAREHKDKGLVMQCSHLVMRPIALDQMIGQPDITPIVSVTSLTAGKVAGVPQDAMATANGAQDQPILPLSGSSEQTSYNCFRCLECKEQCKDKAGLAAHFQQAVTAGTVCTTCPMMMPNPCSFNAHQRMHKNRPPHVCPECGGNFLLANFEAHLKEACLHFSRRVGYRCPSCAVVFGGVNSIKSHIQTSHCEVFHKCPICPMAFKSAPSAHAHIYTQHPGFITCGMIYKCAMCDTVFTHKPLLSSHFDQHLLNQRVSVFKCPDCPLLFAQKRTMLEHLKVSRAPVPHLLEVAPVSKISESSSSSSEEDEPPSSPELRKAKRTRFQRKTDASKSKSSGWTCGMCHSWFPERDEYVSHMKKDHGKVRGNPRTRARGRLLFTFTSSGRGAQGSLITCLALVPPRYCTEGKRTFSSRLILEKHIQVRHGIKVTDQTKSQEVVIARTGPGSLKRKLSSDEGDSCSEEPDSTTPPSKNPKADRKAPFRCRKCGYVACSAAEFQEHIPQHRTDESSHQCRECGLCFTSQVSLNRHRFITHKKKKGAGEVEEPSPRSGHEGGAQRSADGKLVCKVCGKCFDTQLNLKTHFRTHGMAFIRARQNVSPEN